MLGITNIKRSPLRTIGALLAVGMSLWLSGGCKSVHKHPTSAEKRATVEGETKRFDPGYFKDESKRHLAIEFAIAEGLLKPPLTGLTARFRPGTFPYHPPGAGDTVIIFNDEDGQKLGSYTIEDPTKYRSCDLGPERMGHVTPIPSGSTELLFPNNPKIDHFVIVYEDDRRQEFDLREMLRSLFKPKGFIHD